MKRYDLATGIAVRPTPLPAGTDRWHQRGDALAGIKGSSVDADWLNDLDANIAMVLVDGAIAGTKGPAGDANLRDAIRAIAAAAVVAGAPKLAAYADRQAAGASAPTYTVGGWRTVTLNTEEYDPDGVGALSANQVTLPAGRYDVAAEIGVRLLSGFIGQLRIVGGGSTLALGATEWADSKLTLAAPFTLAASTAVELQVRVNASTSAWAAPSDFGEAVVFSRLLISKLR